MRKTFVRYASENDPLHLYFLFTNYSIEKDDN